MLSNDRPLFVGIIALFLAVPVLLQEHQDGTGRARLILSNRHTDPMGNPSPAAMVALHELLQTACMIIIELRHLIGVERFAGSTWRGWPERFSRLSPRRAGWVLSIMVLCNQWRHSFCQWSRCWPSGRVSAERS